MADKINGYGGRTGIDVGQARSRAVNRNEREAGAAAARRAGDGGDAVDLTDNAARLKAIEARLADIPEVDQARVKAMRERVDSGEYKPDASRIATKLLRLEKAFA
jgi:negative regulator of flagellin synthesis FlgM